MMKRRFFLAYAHGLSCIRMPSKTALMLVGNGHTSLSSNLANHISYARTYPNAGYHPNWRKTSPRRQDHRRTVVQ